MSEDRGVLSAWMSALWDFTRDWWADYDLACVGYAGIIKSLTVRLACMDRRRFLSHVTYLL